jgi:pimeloyl-ACP methyl ester carboxylesterase
VNRNPLRSFARSAHAPSRIAHPVTVHLRRMYVDCRHGQLHVHTAFPSSGGFDELTPLVCIHPAPGSGRVFRGLIAELGRERSAYALDLPGYGESDAPDSPPTVADYAAACADFLDSLRLRQVDVLGYQGGSQVAAELALARPEQVRRVVLLGMPAFDAGDREQYAARPWPLPLRDDGTQLAEEWARLRRTRGVLATASSLGRELGESLRAGERAGWGAAAMAAYAAGERLPLLRRPTLLLRSRDEFAEMTARAEGWLPEVRRAELSGHTAAVLESDPAEIAGLVKDFLDI